ncbi:EI24 domain-containing protein [Oscillatoria sp. FACHB-1407]|uniref:EI24 domain-containing protein n=1 Tax=Oscillatoria sp. FACHB-1407 TaxID=2692847 RepID=UPI0016884CF2|nr:EI24 domain-containing protein [Oscillatoria sp. FACHB-1407]MBD2462759.1 EI24 domain-containing protein [Oscillatoria sp. FACHB-1407]
MTNAKGELKPAQGVWGIFAGITYPLRSLGLLITTPQLRGYVLIPIVVNVVVGLTLYTSLLLAGFEAIESVTANLPAWIPNFSAWNLNVPAWLLWLQNLPVWVSQSLDWLAIAFGWLIYAILVVLLLIATGFVLLQFGVLLGAPWYGKLSEELEKLQTGHLPVAESNVLGIFRDVGRAIQYELKKLVITLGIGLPLLFLNFLPGLGTAIATIGGIAIAATIVCLDFLDPALERRRLRFRDKLGVIRRSLPASATFALGCLFLVSVPFLNLLAIPVCVGAGTLFFCDRVLPIAPELKGKKDDKNQLKDQAATGEENQQNS